MKQVLCIVLVAIAAVSTSACRLGSGFDSTGRLVGPRMNTGDAAAKVDKPAGPVEPAKTDVAPKLATIVYLIPAG